MPINNKDRLATVCQRMFIATQFVLFSMLLLNGLAWIFPSIVQNGLSFSLTDSMANHLNVDVFMLPWWQRTGAILLSSLPLMILAYGLFNLARLFRTYAKQAYFSADAALYLGRTAKMVILWVIARLLCEPLLSVWLTMHNPVGERLITLTCSPGDVMTLFLGACIGLIAHILKKASQIHAENKMFV